MQSRDGQFQLFYRDNYACLTVYPPEGSGRTVYPEDVIGRLKVLDLRGVRRQKILEVIEEAAGEPVPIALWPEGRKLGPKMNLETSDDAMTAQITIEPERQGGEPLSASMIKGFLQSCGIVFGIDREIINSIVLKKIYNQPVKIAFGCDAVDERPPEPEYFFLTDRGKPFKELEFERIDLKELNFIQNKKKGDIIAKLGAPVPASDGTDIFGRKLLASRGAVEPVFSAGEGSVMSEDGKTITATIDGNARLDKGRVIVEPLISVEDVDYSNGNMDFAGSLDVRGRIADGFNIKAKGDIQIGKSVSRVSITGGGDIILKAGITGNDEGIIVCEGDLYARYIESASILCRGTIYVEEAIMHSSVKAGGDIVLKGKRAEIFGGRIFSAGSITCKKLGSINEPLTEVFLGTDLDSYTALEKLQQRVSEHSSKVDELDLQIRQIKNAQKNLAADDQKDISKVKLETARTQLTNEFEIRNKMLSNALRELHDLKRDIILNEESVLSVEDRIFSKVHVYFSHLRWDSPGKGTGKTSLMVKKGKLLEK
ncbi:MAG: FapA family protein [Spirochaetales bacterium]|uniref:FapA family protein n=1 Tax=Candidatus Thalassospirochaeta sargassi TaxID=3119039 RepID=A0AAJ1IF78_9SPIO|nr:FapA family protein [Spirochaetales bacterium]